MPIPVDPSEALQLIQVVSYIYLAISFGIVIYQVILNRRQAQVKELMIELIAEVKSIHKTIKNAR